MQIDESKMTLEELRRYHEGKLKLIYQYMGITDTAIEQNDPVVPLNPYNKKCPNITDPQISKIPKSKAIRLILQKAYPEYLIPKDVIKIMEKNGVVFTGNQRNSVRIALTSMAKDGKIESVFIVEGKKDRMYRLKPEGNSKPDKIPFLIDLSDETSEND
jgi:hypothetical protein